MNDRRRLLLAVHLAFSLMVILFIAGELFIRLSKQDLRKPKKTASVIQVVLGQSAQGNLDYLFESIVDSAPMEPRAAVPHEEFSLPTDLHSVNLEQSEQRKIEPHSVISEMTEPSAVNLGQTKHDAVALNSAEGHLAEIERTALNSDDDIFSPFESFYEVEKNKLTEMIYAFIEKEKQYPPLARRRNIEGQVGIMITVSHSGELIDSGIVSSSDSVILNQAAINLVKSIFPLNIILQSETAVNVTIHYSLKD